MKKLFFILLIPAFLFGCSLNTKAPSNKTVIQNASNNLSSLTNVDFREIQADFGTPSKAIYYIDTNDLSSKGLDALTLDDLRDNVITFASYQDPSNPDKYLNIFFEDGLVKKTLLGDFDRLLSVATTEGYEYKVEFHKGRGIINAHNFVLESIQSKFVGKTLANFNKYFDVRGANFIASTVNGDDKLNFYPLVNQNLEPKSQNKYPNYNSNLDAKLGYINPINNNISSSNKFSSDDLHLYMDKAVMIYTDKNNVIEYISIADSDVLYGVITNMLGPNGSKSNSK